MEEYESIDELTWYGYNLSDEAFFTKAVKALQKISRSTIEYNIWQSRTKMDKKNCPVCECAYDYIEPETHHYPKTMFNVIADILQQHIDDNNIEEFEPLDIIQEVMHKHLANRIDNIVLCAPCHKKFHNNDPEVIDKLYDIWEIHLKELKEKMEIKQKLVQSKKNNELTDFKDIG